MSYTRDRTIYHFCAMCQLVLRFWDKVNLRGQIQDLLDAGWGPLTIVSGINYDSSTGSIEYAAITATINMSTGDTRRLRVLAGPDNSGSVNYYKDVTQHGVISWRSSSPGVVTINAATGMMRAASAGTTTVTAAVGSTASNGVRVRVT